MKNLKKYLELSFSFSQIPTYIYEDKHLITYLCSTNNSFEPPEKYLQNFLNTTNQVTYLMTDFYSFYFCIRFDKTSIIFGPVSEIPPNREFLQTLRREFFVLETSFDDFVSHFSSIPTMSLNKFLDYISMINFSINKTEFDPVELQSHEKYSEIATFKNYALNGYTDLEDDNANNSYDYEQKILHYVEKGDIDSLLRLTYNSNNINVGIFANDNLRQIKNGSIIIIALACRSAIKKGVPYYISFHLSDAYIQQLETLTSITAIQELTKKALINYTTKINENLLQLSNDISINKAIQFIHNNTNKPINATDVAKHVGFSRTYFSQKFKKELGFELSSFIRRCKLEQSKELLSYTDKSISDISNFLYFSSQAHFQTAFKKQYGVTPNQFRIIYNSSIN